MNLAQKVLTGAQPIDQNV